MEISKGKPNTKSQPQRKDEESLSMSDALYRKLFENMLEGCAVCEMIFDDDGRPIDWIYLNVNKAFEELTGLREIVGKRVSEAVPGLKETNPEVFDTYGRVALSGQPESFQMHIIPLSIWQDIYVFCPEHGRFIAIFSNITKHKLAEEALHDEEDKFRHVFESANVGKSITLPTGEIFVNAAFCDMVGYSQVELQNKKWQEITPDDEIDLTQAIIDTLLKGEKDAERFRKRYIHKNGTLVWADVSVTVRRDANGVPLHFITTAVDITSQKLAEDHLRETKEFLENLLNYTNAPIIVWDSDYQITLFNHAFEHMTGHQAAEVIGERLEILFPADSCEASMDLIRRTSLGEHWDSVEIPIQRIDGSVRIALWNSATLLAEDGLTVVATIAQGKDITVRKQVEEENRKQQATLKGILESTSSAVFSVDREYRYTSFNHIHAQVMKAIYGAEIEFGKNMLDYFTILEDREKAKINLDCALAGKQFVDESFSGDGLLSRRYFEVTHNPIYDENNLCAGVAVFAEDITAKKTSELALFASEAKFRKLYDSMMDAFVIVDMGGRITEFNEAYLRLTGYSSGDIINLTYRDLTPDTWHEMETDIINEQVMTRGYSDLYEKEYRRKDGSIVPINLRTYLLRDDSSKSVGMWAIVRDISERKHAERQIIRLNRIFSVLSAINETIVRLDNRQQLLDEACRIAVEVGQFRLAWVGYLSQGENRVKVCASAGSDDHYTETLDINPFGESGVGPTGTAIREGKTTICNDIATDTRMEFWREKALARAYHSSISLPLMITGKSDYVINFYSTETDFFNQEEVSLLEQLASDISYALNAIETENLRILANQALQESEEKFALAFQTSPYAITITRVQDGTFVEVNQAFSLYTGYSRDEALQNFSIGLELWNDQEDRGRAIRDLLNGTKVIGQEYQFKRKHGEVFPGLFSAELIHLGNEQCVLSSINDITERKRAEDEIQRRAAEVQLMFKNMLNAFIVWESKFDDNGNYVSFRFGFFNAAYARISGLRQEDVLSKDVFEVWPGTERSWIEVYGQVAITGIPNTFDMFHTPTKGWYHCNAYRPTDSSASICVIFEDITVAKQAQDEIVRLNDELEERIRIRTAELEVSNKELESFAYSVSHDLRAPLRGIDGFSQALLEDCLDQLDSHGKDYLNRIRKATQRMAQLIDDILSLSRLTRKEVSRHDVNLSAIVGQIVNDLSQTQPERNIEWVIAEYAIGSCDPHLLTIAMENLLRNAWKFTSKTPSPRIEFGCYKEEEEAIYFIRDNGAGFDMTYANKLFGIFQRLHTEAEFEGTGVGLATVQRIIHKHGGRIWAEGVVGKGAAFYFTL